MFIVLPDIVEVIPEEMDFFLEMNLQRKDNLESLIPASTNRILGEHFGLLANILGKMMLFCNFFSLFLANHGCITVTKNQ